jgi:methionine synthase I (cobalamin-dependent)
LRRLRRPVRGLNRIASASPGLKELNMLQSLLAEGRPLLADGATGTNLFVMGLTSGDAPELWNAEHPDRIESLHQAFVDAGSDIILTNSFGANRRRLMLHKLEGRTRELNRLAAEVARKVADSAGRPVVVAGSIGPTGDLLAPLGPLSEDEAVDVFIEQIEGLREGGADVAWIETMSAPEEMRAAAIAAGKFGMPYALTASFDTAGRTMMGVAPTAFSGLVEAFDPAPVAYGANCGVGASDLLAAILGMREGAMLIAKANAGVPQWHGAEIHYSGTPELMETYAALAADCGARIVGGCCGNTPAHVAAMRRGLDARKPGARPDVEEIVAALGPLVAPPAGETGGRTRRRERA